MIMRRTIKQGILNKVFLQIDQVDQGEGSQIHQRQV